MHGLFLTSTQKARCIYKLCIAILTECTAISIIINPLHQQRNNPALLTWRASFFARGDEYPSNLVSGLPRTVPPLGFYPLTLSQPHSSNYIIYIDDINNLSRPRLGQELFLYVNII